MAEAVEVADAQAGGGRGPDALVDPLAQLARRLDVVGQDEELLGQEVLLRLEQPADALDDDAGLAGARAGDDDDRPVAMLDDGPLLIGQREVLGAQWRPAALRRCVLLPARLPVLVDPLSLPARGRRRPRLTGGNQCSSCANGWTNAFRTRVDQCRDSPQSDEMSSGRPAAASSELMRPRMRPMWTAQSRSPHRSAWDGLGPATIGVVDDVSSLRRSGRA